MRRCYVCGKRIWFSPVRVVVKKPDKKLSMPVYPDVNAEAVRKIFSLGQSSVLWVHEGCLDKLEINEQGEQKEDPERMLEASLGKLVIMAAKTIWRRLK